MKKNIILTIAFSTIILAACQSKQKTDSSLIQEPLKEEMSSDLNSNSIDYQIAENYFVKNNAGKLEHPKIETLEKFNSIFGMATTMGKRGKPTTIDFSKQDVIALVLPETNLETSLKIVSLERDSTAGITLKFKKIEGKKQTFTTIPNFAIIVDKTDDANVNLLQIN